MVNNMEKIIINQHLIQYRIIEELDRVSYYTSAFLFHDNGEGILIDAGYYQMGLDIKKDIESMGINLKFIILTHYHKDHAQGAISFDTPIIASNKYKPNFDKGNALSEHQYRKPNKLVDEYYEIILNTSRVEIYATPGHTPCGLSVFVNQSYLFVSDNLLEDIDNNIIIPYLDVTANPYDHYKTILLYDSLNPKHLLLTHGPIKMTPDLNYEFSERLFYLEQFIKSHYEASLEDCIIRDKSNYAMTAIHKANSRNAKKYVSAQPISFS